MNENASVESSARTRRQYGIRSLMFTTFVIALCAALLKLSVVVGCVAAAPVTLALWITLGRGQDRKSGLVVTFFQSIAVIICLLLTLGLNLIACVVAAGLFLLHATIHICAQASLIAVFLFRVASETAERSRTATAWVGSRATGVASWLHQTNRKLFAVLCG